MLKILIILVFLSIVASLGIALFHLIRNKESSEKTVKALTYRISISLALFILLTIALMSGLIQPAGIGMQMQLQKEKIAEQQNN
ncbi:MAG: twin transmembrane helix small protein [Gammaproteobacteria bacterium]|jgi:putative copper export protein|uniref:twin transmembrane helix small protein n=1 Tax=Methyloprofundus sp. TaxID=2020875 RepID=UPI001A11C4F0|nr:twin transmembrane helix small protein [Methyloprofundus sp.]MBT3813031.1 twin transmembrane helix small protein [Gammaproteobacteria bacterium]HIL77793.1 twin transmembrane helix small protein [Methylococcales bacterium]MBT4147487.1 twin transmembrane helix small protein [Gammaproteobacteria bacterium]MBT5223525.1 twin transmembrane helix small protein [Gammaproteobacteria bacterium]MBT5826633.1 twin transmembrane helix small protein [Gammaproteobacteria bacterium]